MAERLIAFAQGADALIGPGSVVDSYVGPALDSSEGRTDSKEDLAAQLGDLAATARAQGDELGDPECIDIAENAWALRVRLSPAARSYTEVVAQTMGAALPRIDKSAIRAIRRQLLATLKEAGYGDQWPDSIRRWRASREVDAIDYLALLRDKADAFRGPAMTRLLPESWEATITLPLNQRFGTRPS